MNPNKTIKLWLLAAGKQFGITEAWDYIRPDDDTRPQEMYCTYRSVSGVPDQATYQDITTKDGYTAVRKGFKTHLQRYQIDLYNSEDGLYELESMALAAQHNPSMQALFTAQSCQFKTASEVTNETDVDNYEIEHHFRMFIEIEENVEFSLDDLNAVVETIELTLNSDHTTQTITVAKVECATGDIVMTGSATFSESAPT